MNTVFSNATEADLNAGDNICIICREEMVAVASNSREQSGNVPKCLPCTHIFHCACLKTWFQRQQTCPTCRMDILRNAQQQRTSPNDRRPNQNATPNVATSTPSTTPNASTQQPPTTPATNAQVPSPMNMPPFSPVLVLACSRSVVTRLVPVTDPVPVDDATATIAADTGGRAGLDRVEFQLHANAIR